MAEADSTSTSSSFQPAPPFLTAYQAGLQSAVIGTFASAVLNTFQKHDRGAWGVVTRTGGTIGLFSAMGFTYAYVRQLVSNIRITGPGDGINAAAGGCAAGFLAGIRKRSLSEGLGGCMILGGITGTYDLAGHSMPFGSNLTEEEKNARRQAFFKQGSTLNEEPTA